MAFKSVGERIQSLTPAVVATPLEEDNMKTVTFPNFRIPAGQIPDLDEMETDDECVALVKVVKLGDNRDTYGSKKRYITLEVRAIEYPVEDTEEVDTEDKISARY